MLIGSEIFEKTQLAKEKTEKSQDKENITLLDYENKIEHITSNREEINMQKFNLGDHVIYKNNNFEIVRKIGTAIILVCIPNANTPTITLKSYTALENCESILNNACREYFVNEELGIKNEDIYNARKVHYDNGWVSAPEKDEDTEYWLASGCIRDNNKAVIYTYSVTKNNGITARRMASWYESAEQYTSSICPIIIIEASLLKDSGKNYFIIE